MDPSTYAILAVLISQSVVGALLIRQMARQVNDLHQWHNVKDGDGVFSWYVRRSLETAIIKLAENIEAQTELLRDLIHERRQP